MIKGRRQGQGMGGLPPWSCLSVPRGEFTDAPHLEPPSECHLEFCFQREAIEALRSTEIVYIADSLWVLFLRENLVCI